MSDLRGGTHLNDYSSPDVDKSRSYGIVDWHMGAVSDGIFEGGWLSMSRTGIVLCSAVLTSTHSRIKRVSRRHGTRGGVRTQKTYLPCGGGVRNNTRLGTRPDKPKPGQTTLSHCTGRSLTRMHPGLSGRVERCDPCVYAAPRK